MKLNNQNIFIKTDQKILWDDQLKGFGVRIYESGKRSFIIQIFASFMVNKGIPVRLISELLGHSNIQTTLRYAHVFDKSLKKAVDLI